MEISIHRQGLPTTLTDPPLHSDYYTVLEYQQTVTLVTELKFLSLILQILEHVLSNVSDKWYGQRGRIGTYLYSYKALLRK